MRYRLLLMFLLSVVSQSHAHVQDTLNYQYYEVVAKQNQSLAPLLINASPIRQGGQKFYGYTKWDIHWNIRLDKNNRGNCRPRAVKTTLITTITLPKLMSDDPDQQLKFEGFISALKQHELGHYQFGKAAATAIDRELYYLPAMRHCSSLKKRVNDTANRTLELYQEKDRSYDAATEHGKSQGAWLDH